ncbi:hypothetical protein P5V15_001911 [Pogonomyrmex californicus]
MSPVSGVLLLLLTCQLATSTPIFDRDRIGLHGRSSGFGETIRDWFRVIKERIVGKWQEWFGGDNPTPKLSPQDILNIDKSIESRIPSYPGFFLDLSSLSFDPKRDWGVRLGNWYIIRKVTGDSFNPDSDSDEWDLRPLLPNLPSPPILGINWTPDFRKFEIPEATQSPTTTPNIETTTSRQQTTQTVTQTQSVLTSTESTVTTTEETAATTEETAATTEETVVSTETIISTESIPVIIELTRTSTEPNVTTEKILTSSESVTNTESVTVSTESVLVSTESNTELTVSSIESTILTTESMSSTVVEPSLTSVKSIETFTESIVITTESIMTSTEELTTITTSTEPPVTSTIITSTESPVTTELILPTFNKRIEDNEITKRTTMKPHPASAEVIMF